MRSHIAALVSAMCCLGMAGAGAAEPSAKMAPAVYSPADGAPSLQQVRTIHVYSCTARSSFAYGVWTAPLLATARTGALYQCAIRTPRGYLCVITACR